MISAILIVKNEAHHLKDCLTSISWADEIIVVDSGSDDGSQKICKQFNCRLLETDWPGFGPQKNRALDLATHDWIFSIDADERVSPKLRDEILKIVESTPEDGFDIPRNSTYCGRFIKHAGWTPDYVLRLFRKDKGRFSNDKVHEKVNVQGSVSKLVNPLTHYSFDTLDQVLDKVNHYSTLGAQQLYAQGKRASLGKAIGKGIWSFIRTYFLRRGILDGREGLMLAISNAEGTYYKYAKLALLSRQKNDH